MKKGIKTLLFQCVVITIGFCSCTSQNEPEQLENQYKNLIQYHYLSDYDLLGKTHNDFLDFVKNHEESIENKECTRTIIDEDAYVDYLHNLQLEYVKTLQFDDPEDQYKRIVSYKRVAISALASGVVSSCGGWGRILKWGWTVIAK